jgi:hypothetical protein
MNVIRKILKYPALWIVVAELILIVILGLFGFRITYSPSLNDCWVAIGAMGQWASACVGILIPIAAVYLQQKLDRNKEDISKSNVSMLEELEEFKRKFEKQLDALSGLVDEDGNITIDGGTALALDTDKWQHLKDEAIRLVDIAMSASTQYVAEHLKIPNDDAFHLLKELALHDHSISCAGQLTDKNIDGVVWLPKSGK